MYTFEQLFFYDNRNKIGKKCNGIVKEVVFSHFEIFIYY